MRKKEEIFLKYRGGGIAHGRATPGTGHAQASGKSRFWVGLAWHGLATTGTGHASVSGL